MSQVLAAGDLFDERPTAEWARRFLEQPGHHLLLAYVDDTPVGMVTGVEMTHPDKGTEMFLYELGVADDHQRHGIGQALTRALARLAEDQGCFGMWVLTERENTAAVATYRRGGAEQESEHVLLSWSFGTSGNHHDP